MVVTDKEEITGGVQSTYLEYLPSIYSQNNFMGRYSQGDFMGRFLMIFESIMRPLEELLDNIPFYFDAGTTPEELLPWLASWVNLALDANWPVEQHRQLVKSAVQIFEWRGTRRGLREYVKAYTGVEPSITEDFGGITLGETSNLGWNTILGEGGGQHTFNISLVVDDTGSVNVEQLKAIIESEKPAHVGYSLQIVARDSQF